MSSGHQGRWWWRERGLLLGGTETFESGHYGEWASYGSAHDGSFSAALNCPMSAQRKESWLQSTGAKGLPGDTESKKSGRRDHARGQ